MPTPQALLLNLFLNLSKPLYRTVVLGKSQQSLRSKNATQELAKAKSSARYLSSSKQTGECWGMASGHRFFNGTWLPCHHSGKSQLGRALSIARLGGGEHPIGVFVLHAPG